MPGTYSDVATLAADASYQAKIKVALLDAAIDIMAEATTTPQYDRRRELAIDVLRNPDAHVARVALIVAASNETIRAAAPAVPADGDVQFVVNSIWTTLAVK